VNWQELLGVRQELGEGGERRLVKKKILVTFGISIWGRGKSKVTSI